MKGKGEKEDPYLISNLKELSNIRDNPSSYYKIIDDIDARKTKNWNDDKGFEPVPRFDGVINGNNKSIYGLTIVRPRSLKMLGMFESIGRNAVIKNLNMIDCSIFSLVSRSGAICGFNKGEITNCLVTGDLNTKRTSGGIAGWSQENEISNSLFLGSIEPSCNISSSFPCIVKRKGPGSRSFGYKSKYNNFVIEVRKSFTKSEFKFQNVDVKIKIEENIIYYDLNAKILKLKTKNQKYFTKNVKPFIVQSIINTNIGNVTKISSEFKSKIIVNY